MITKVILVDKKNSYKELISSFFLKPLFKIIIYDFESSDHKLTICNKTKIIIISNEVFSELDNELLNRLNKEKLTIAVTNSPNSKISKTTTNLTYFPKGINKVDFISKINALLMNTLNVKEANTNTSDILNTCETDLLFRKSSLGIAFFNTNYNITQCNVALNSLLKLFDGDSIIEHLLENKQRESIYDNVALQKDTLNFTSNINSRKLEFKIAFNYGVSGELNDGILIVTDVTENHLQKINGMELTSIKHSTLIAIFKLDKNGIILDWNVGAEKIFQFKKDEICGELFTTIVPVESIADLEGIIKGVFKSSKETQFTKICQKKDGSCVTVSFTITPVKNENNFTESVYIFASDTTGFKRLTEELKNYRYAIDKSAIVAMVNRDGNILNANANFFKSYEYKKEQIIGKPISLLRPKEYDNKTYESLWKTVESGKIWRGELLAKSSSGDERWMDTTITPFIDSRGIPFKYMTVLYDITKKKLLEEKDRLNILMDKSLKMKDEFLANMSHEIRTPLNVILGYADLLLESETSNEQYKQISTIKKSGKLLLSIINDILDLSKLESGKLVLDDTPFNLHELISSVKDMLGLEAVKKDLDFRVNIDTKVPKYVLGDATRIEQILVNIINNAIKFTKIGFVKVDVKLVSKALDVNQIMFKISDSGIGIPKDKIETIFESFTQTSRYITREFGGTGLGLTIVKKLINQLNGTLELDSIVNKGSDFHITIPFKLPNKSDLELNKVPVIAAQSNTALGELDLNILLVEDNEYNQILAKTRLNVWKCNVDIAPNGLEAIEKLRKNDYHLILMDIQMPIMNGYEATKRIRTEFSGYKKEIPIIALTAHASNSDAKRTKEIGFNDYLFKPYNLKLLYQTLEKYGSLSIETSEAYGKFEKLEGELIKVKSSELIDFSYIEGEALGHTSILKMLIESFLREFEIFIENSQKACKNEDWNGVYKAIHKINPSIINFDLNNIKPLALELYENSKQQVNSESYIGIIDKMTNEFNKVRPIIQKKLLSLDKEILQSAI